LRLVNRDILTCPHGRLRRRGGGSMRFRTDSLAFGGQIRVFIRSGLCLWAVPCRLRRPILALPAEGGQCGFGGQRGSVSSRRDQPTQKWRHSSYWALPITGHRLAWLPLRTRIEPPPNPPCDTVTKYRYEVLRMVGIALRAQLMPTEHSPRSSAGRRGRPTPGQHLRPVTMRANNSNNTPLANTVKGSYQLAFVTPGNKPL
jgi:hypothetical protein